MEILIFIAVVVVLLALAIYGINALPMQPPFGNILIVIVVLMAIIVIAHRAGIF